MVNQLTAHLERPLSISEDGWTRTSLLSHIQHGYRKNMSTQTNILQLLEDTLKDAENGYDNGLLMCDCSAAFDTVPHDILMKKQRLYGLSESALEWFKSYIEGRCQYVEVGGKASKVKLVCLGCFQGSIGAPLLYILYMNDLVVLEEARCKVSLYADDNNYSIRLSNNTPDNKSKIESKMGGIRVYMNANRLKLNPEKTKLMILTTKNKDMHKDLRVEIDGVEIEKVTFAKFLGLIISGNMKWNDYIIQSENSLLKYCNKRLSVLKLLAGNCGQSQRNLPAHGLIISKITYCISTWASCPGYLKKRVQEIMSETAKIVH